jgi:hypothetical protein
MRISNPLLLWLGASTALAAMQSPHGKFPQRSLAQPVLAKDAARKPQTTNFLNKNSKSRSAHGTGM